MPHLGNMTKEEREEAEDLCTRAAIDYLQMGLAIKESQYLNAQTNVDQIRKSNARLQELLDFRGTQESNL